MDLKAFSNDEHATWAELYRRQSPLRSVQMHPLFNEGIKKLGFTESQIPDLKTINQKLNQLTGFQGVPVKGFEEPIHFFEMLSRREFPIGNFIRDRKDLSYTPEPDVFHDLYGHIPFFADADYADFCERFGKKAVEMKHIPTSTEQFNRLFWFTIEFALIETPEGKRIFGAGIASSFTECAYALSNEPEVLPFNLDTIRNQPFKIDELQKRLFILKDKHQLYSCLDNFQEHIQST